MANEKTVACLSHLSSSAVYFFLIKLQSDEHRPSVSHNKCVTELVPECVTFANTVQQDDSTKCAVSLLIYDILCFAKKN